MLQSFCPHSLRQSIDQPFADQTSGIGSDVARGKPGSTGGDDQLGVPRIVPQGHDDGVDLVRHGPHQHGRDSGRFKQSRNGRTGDVLLLPFGAAVAHSQYNGTRLGRKG